MLVVLGFIIVYKPIFKRDRQVSEMGVTQFGKVILIYSERYLIPSVLEMICATEIISLQLFFLNRSFQG